MSNAPARRWLVALAAVVALSLASHEQAGHRTRALFQRLKDGVDAEHQLGIGLRLVASIRLLSVMSACLTRCPADPELGVPRSASSCFLSVLNFS